MFQVRFARYGGEEWRETREEAMFPNKRKPLGWTRKELFERMKRNPGEVYESDFGWYEYRWIELNQVEAQ